MKLSNKKIMLHLTKNSTELFSQLMHAGYETISQFYNQTPLWSVLSFKLFRTDENDYKNPVYLDQWSGVITGMDLELEDDIDKINAGNTDIRLILVISCYDNESGNLLYRLYQKYGEDIIRFSNLSGAIHLVADKDVNNFITEYIERMEGENEN